MDPIRLPPGYPVELESRTRLADGTEVFVRPVVPADAATLAEAAQTADSETLYYRFFTPTPRMDERTIHYLTELDYRHRLAIAAFLPDGEGVAVVRYEGEPGSDSAEVALTVKAGHRRRGLATLLFEKLEAAAVDRGVRRFAALYLPENEPVARLLERLGFGAPAISQGIAEVSKALVPAAE